MRYVIELSDVDGTACRIRLSIPLLTRITSQTNSNWVVLTEGVLRFRSGGCEAQKLTWGGNVDVFLCAGNETLITINGMFDAMTLVNSSGSGHVVERAVLSMKPGPVTWALIE